MGLSSITFHAVVVISLVLVFQVSARVPTCPTPRPTGRITIKETAPRGTVLFTMEDQGLQFHWAFQVGSHPEYHEYLTSFFAVLAEDRVQKVMLIKPLDLEAIYDQQKFVASNEDIQLTLTCLPPGSKRWVEFPRRVSIQPVNEFPPVLHQVTVDIMEEQQIDTLVANLNNYVTDRDVGQHVASNSRVFLVNPLTDKRRDAERYFRVDVVGEIFVTHRIDFDNGVRDCTFNITVMENNGLESTSIVEMRIVNINDNAPTFLYLGCDWGCVDTHYLATASGCFIGELTAFRYGPINAIDPDNEPVLFRIVHASPQSAIKYVTFSETTGTINVTKHLGALPTDTVGFVIEAHDTKQLRTLEGNWAVKSRFTNLYIAIEQPRCTS